MFRRRFSDAWFSRYDSPFLYPVFAIVTAERFLRVAPGAGRDALALFFVYP